MGNIRDYSLADQIRINDYVDRIKVVPSGTGLVSVIDPNGNILSQHTDRASAINSLTNARSNIRQNLLDDPSLVSKLPHTPASLKVMRFQVKSPAGTRPLAAGPLPTNTPPISTRPMVAGPLPNPVNLIPNPVNPIPNIPAGGVGGGGMGFGGLGNFGTGGGPLPNTPLFNFLRALVPMHQRYFLRRVAQGLRGAYNLQRQFAGTATPLMRGAMGLAGGVGGAVLGYESGGTIPAIGGGVGGAVGGLFGPIAGALGASLGTVAGIVVDKFVKGILSNIRKSYDAGYTAANAIASGAANVIKNTSSAGTDIANALVRAITAPFGASGSAVASMVQTIGSTFNRALGGGLNLAVRGLSIAGGLASAYTTIAATVMTGFFAALINPLFVGVGALVGSFAGLLLSRVFSVVGQAVGHVLSAIGEAVGELGKVAAQAITSVVELLQDVMNTALQYSKQVFQLSSQTGLGLGQATGTINAFQLAGISPSATNSMFRGFDNMPDFFRNRASLFGLPGYENPEFLPKLATAFQGRDQWSRMLMMQFMGLDNPEMMQAANTNPSLLRQNIAYGQNLQQSLGLSPEKIAQVAQQWSLLTTRASFAVDMIKNRFAADLLPYLATGLERVTTIIANNAGAISNFIKNTVNFMVEAFKWAFTQLPNIAVRGLQLFTGIIHTTLNMLAVFLRATADALSAFRQGQGMYPFVREIASGLDLLLNSFRKFIIAFAVINSAIYDIIRAIVTTGNTVVSAIPIIGPALSIAAQALLGATPVANPINAGALASRVPISNLAGAVDKIQTSAITRVAQVKIADAASTVENVLGTKIFDRIDTTLADWSKATDPDTMKAILDQFGGDVKAFGQAVKDGMKVVVVTKDNPDALSRVASYIAEDVFYTAAKE